MRLKLISCEIFYREMCAAIARSVNQVDASFMTKGLHDIGQAEMMPRLQQAIDAVDPQRYDALVLGYGLCNNGVIGLEAGDLPIVIPRAHDCLTLFFGNRTTYEAYFHAHPGVYFETTGWLERGEETGELTQMTIQHITGMDMSWEELVAKYGEDNAKYLQENLCDVTRNYSGITYIRMGIEPDDRFEERARQMAAERGWSFEAISGDMSLIHRLLNGPWDEESFLIVEPRHRVVVRYDNQIIATESIDS